MADRRRSWTDKPYPNLPNFRVNPELKAAFVAVTAKENRPAAQVLRDFMRGYVALREKHAFSAKAKRQSFVVA